MSKTWIELLLLLLAIVALLLFVRVVKAADLDLTLTLPSTIPMDRRLPCGWVDSTKIDPLTGNLAQQPLTDLAEVQVWGRRCGDYDSLLLGAVSCIGMEGKTIHAIVQLAPGTVGWIWARAFNRCGAHLCPLLARTFAVPALDYAPGLGGAYYDNEDETGYKFSRTDAIVDFDWGFSAPDPSMGADLFSIIWTGYVTPAATGTYAWSCLWEDGGILTIGTAKVIDSWAIANEHESIGSMTMVGGLRYPLRLEYRAHNGHASCHLRWTPPAGTKAIVPATALTH